MSDEQVPGGAPPAPAPTTTQAAPPAPEQTIPYSRFHEVVKERNAAQEKAAQAASLAAALQEAQAKAASLETQFSTFRTVASTIGHTDPEAIDLVSWSYGRLPQENRPALGDWLGAVKADPAQAPLAIRHLLPQAANTAPVPAPAPVPTQATSPRAAPSAVAGAPASTPSLSPADVARIREQCQRTGDWTAWKEVRKTIG